MGVRIRVLWGYRGFVCRAFRPVFRVPRNFCLYALHGPDPALPKMRGREKDLHLREVEDLLRLLR
jgi:hypothetical protein